MIQQQNARGKKQCIILCNSLYKYIPRFVIRQKHKFINIIQYLYTNSSIFHLLASVQLLLCAATASMLQKEFLPFLPPIKLQNNNDHDQYSIQELFYAAATVSSCSYRQPASSWFVGHDHRIHVRILYMFFTFGATVNIYIGLWTDVFHFESLLLSQIQPGKGFA